MEKGRTLGNLGVNRRIKVDRKSVKKWVTVKIDSVTYNIAEALQQQLHLKKYEVIKMALIILSYLTQDYLYVEKERLKNSRLQICILSRDDLKALGIRPEKDYAVLNTRCVADLLRNKLLKRIEPLAKTVERSIALMKENG